MSKTKQRNSPTSHRRGPLSFGKPTIRMVADEAGVSVATVSRVLNGAVVLPESEERVQKAIKKLNFVRNSAARSLSLHRTDTLGLIFPEISGPFFSEIIRGIETISKRDGRNLLICSTKSHDIPTDSRNFPLGKHNSDGLIIVSDALSDEAIRELDAQEMPIVLMHRSSPAGLQIPSVTIENRLGARQLVEHLIGLGHNEIAFITGPPEHEDANLRYMGYCDALQSHDLPVITELIATGDFSKESGEAAMRQLLARKVTFSALFAADDETAIGAMEELQRVGLRIPDDVSVVGFDDIEIARYIQPPLTTMRVPIEQLGQKAAKLLIAMMDGEAPPVTQLLLPVEFKPRQSSSTNKKA